MSQRRRPERGCRKRTATMAWMALLAEVLLLSAATLCVVCEGKVDYSIGAFYYGPWHRDPTNEKLHGAR